MNDLALEAEQLNTKTGILLTTSSLPSKYTEVVADLANDLHESRKFDLILLTLTDLVEIFKFHLLTEGLERVHSSFNAHSAHGYAMRGASTRDYQESITISRVPQIALQERSKMVTVLFLAADPSDASRLRLGEELREIQEKLQLAKLREQFELYQRMSVRPADISQALLDVQPRIVHFSGHGTVAGVLCFENQIGTTQPVQPDALAALFEQFANQVNCVVLNACYSETQAIAISKHINYVIGMNQAIGDKAAIAFAIGFYQALGAGRKIEEAYKLGCVQIRLQGVPEHLTPVFIKKGQQ